MTTPLKRGDSGQDGKIFWQYVNRKSGKRPWFVSPERFNALKVRERERARRERLEHPERHRERGARALAKFREANPARVKLTPEEAAERQRESARRYYEKNREKVLARMSAGRCSK